MKWVLLLSFFVPAVLVWIGAWRCERSRVWMVIGLAAAVWCLGWFGQWMVHPWGY